jgi:HSP20 family molecular chaperone IbpA
LPALIDEAQEPQATYSDGILKISLKLAKPAETKKIAVKPGSSKKQS